MRKAAAVLIEFILVFNKQSNHAIRVVSLFHPSHVASSGASIRADGALHFAHRGRREAGGGWGSDEEHENLFEPNLGITM